MLEIRCGVASRSHENEFFRTFSQALKAYFDDHAMDGLLIGFPHCKVIGNLQIDALLITDATITIIDFKDYTGSLTLPDADDFKRGLWTLESGITVKGGSSPNPFYQLGLQRDRLGDILRMTARSLTTFDPRHITTLVCFTQPMDILGAIPGNYKLTFFIADSRSFIQKIFDIVNVANGDCGLLTDAFTTYLNTKVFESKPYDVFIEPLMPPSVAAQEVQKTEHESEHEPSAPDSSFGQDIQAFLEGNGDVLIITGTVGSGKYTHSETLRNSAYEAGFTSARIFALSNRVITNLLSTVDEVESLYASIYDFSKREIDSVTGKELIPLASFATPLPFSDLDEEIEPENLRSVFIVYESQMVTDSHRDDGVVRFGTGFLLTDLLTYLSIDGENKNNKLIVVGDDCELSFGSWSQSSLNPEAYDHVLNVAQIHLPDTDTPSEIEKSCLEIADKIRSGDFSELVLMPSEAVELTAPAKEAQLLHFTVKDWKSSKVVTYSNKRAHDLNIFIKRHLLSNGDTLAAGDLVLFNNQITAPVVDTAEEFGRISAFETSEPVTIANGAFGIIESVGQTPYRQSVKFDGLDKPVTLSLVNLRIRLAANDVVVKVCAIREYLDSPTADLSPYEERALQAKLNTLRSDFMKLHPFAKGDPDFDEMIRKGDFEKNAQGLYRDRDDKTQLTNYEKAHRMRLEKMLLADPQSEYAHWIHAARLRYGWCITVHKAMAYRWDEVVFATSYEQGRTNKEFFRFMYTGISRATDRVHLVRWKPVSPFSDTDFVYAPAGPVRIPKPNVATLEGDESPHEAVGKLLEKLKAVGIEVVSLESKSYQEIARLHKDTMDVTLCFDYNKKGEIRRPRYIVGDTDLFDTVVKLLTKTETAVSEHSPLEPMYRRLHANVAPDVTFKVLLMHQNQDIVELSKDTATTSVRVIYKKQGSVSKFELCDGDRELFDTVVSRIKNYYHLSA